MLTFAERIDDHHQIAPVQIPLTFSIHHRKQKVENIL